MNVEQISGKGESSLLIGTYGRTGVVSIPQEVTLHIGENSITADSRGGLLWIRYCSDLPASGIIKVTFKEGYTTAPLFIKNRTQASDFAAQIANAPEGVNDALLVGEKVYLVAERKQEGLSSQNNNNILERIDSYTKIESDLMGLDNSSSLHAPLKVPTLFTVCVPAYAGGWAYNYGAAYSHGVSDNHQFTARHEFGHLNQQLWTVQQETIGQFFSVASAIDADIPKDSYIEGYGNWNDVWAAVNDYFKRTDDDRDYSGAEGQMVPSLHGAGFVSAAMMIQLKLAFGNGFYQNLHKATREEKPRFASSDEKYEYFMLKACQVSKTDLTQFFKKWGFKFPTAYTKIAALNLPQPTIDIATLTTE